MLEQEEKPPLQSASVREREREQVLYHSKFYITAFSQCLPTVATREKVASK